MVKQRGMEKLFIPYKEDKPAYVYINGHCLIILSTDGESLEAAQCVDLDSIQELECNPSDMESIIASLHEDVKGGIIITPTDVNPDELVESLAEELPWIQ